MPKDVIRSPTGVEFHPATQLPPDLGAFCGRRREMAMLYDHLDDDTDRGPGTPRIIVVTGMGGVGKTRLALHWAHMIASRFADQLSVDLQGNTPGMAPLPPIVVLHRFLRALGVPEPPHDAQEAAGRYRTLLSDRSALVFLDNAASSSQVLPLIPANSDCLVLVTSRERRSGLDRRGARRIPLEPLSPDHALEMLTKIVPDGRLRAEPGAARMLASLCGHLPLALSLVGAQLAGNQEQSIAEAVADLETGDPLQIADPEDSHHPSVRTTFAQTYRRLRPDDRQLFRRLGLLPGTELTVHSAAAVNGTGLSETRASLSRLVEAHLVMHAAVPGRYGLHDLLRRYAKHEASSDPRAADAAARFYGWCLAAADAAARAAGARSEGLPNPPPAPGTEVESFVDAAAARDWLDMTLPSLIATAEQARADGHETVAFTLADTLRGYLWNRRRTMEWTALAEAGLRAARSAGDGRAEAAMLLSQGHLAFARGRIDEAISTLSGALRSCERIGWIQGEAEVLNVMAVTFQTHGHLDLAEDCLARGILRARQLGQAATELRYSNNRGVILRAKGRTSDAIRLLTETAERAAQEGLSAIELDSLVNRCNILIDVGRILDAERQLRSLLKRSRLAAARGVEAEICDTLATAALRRGDFQRAERYCRKSMQINRESGNRRGEAANHAVIALARKGLGRLDLALRHARDGQQIAREAGDNHREADCLNAAAFIHLAQGDHDRSVECYGRALTLSVRAQYLWGSIVARIGLARCHMGGRDAVEHAENALSSARSAGFSLLVDESAALVAEIGRQ